MLCRGLGKCFGAVVASGPSVCGAMRARGKASRLFLGIAAPSPCVRSRDGCAGLLFIDNDASEASLHCAPARRRAAPAARRGASTVQRKRVPVVYCARRGWPGEWRWYARGGGRAVLAVSFGGREAWEGSYIGRACVGCRSSILDP